MFAFNHFNFNVTDLERSLAFYRDALGLEPVGRKEAPDGSFILTFLGDGKTDFRLELTARNGCMDHRNTPTDSVFTCYLPFMQESANLEDIQVVHAGMNTLRLMENDDTRLRLIYQPSGKEIFDIPLTPYLLLSRNVETTYMPPQEYLDRQDRYNLIFFLSPTEDPQKPYICLQMQVNGWIIRINDAELDK